MTKIEPFEEHIERFDSWYEQHWHVYQSELNAIKKLIPKGKGLEVGVGTGRFAQPLGIEFGIDPSKKALKVAQKRGVKVFEGFAEALPFEDSSFDFLLISTSIAFFDDIDRAFSEAYRVLRLDGSLIVAIIDKNSKIGEYYRSRTDNPFFKNARFYTTEEIIGHLERANFKEFRTIQTLFENMNIKKVEPVKAGDGEGSFIVVRAIKQETRI